MSMDCSSSVERIQRLEAHLETELIEHGMKLQELEMELAQGADKHDATCRKTEERADSLNEADL